MGVTATFNGHRVTDTRVTIPAWGAWYADVGVDGELTLTGAVTLQIADLTLKGTIIAGGPAKGRSQFRIIGGANGWHNTVPAKDYANDAGVKLSTVLGDAAQSVGETLDTTTFDPTTRVGLKWVRPSDQPASRLLQLLAPQSWYIREDGVTCLGKRAASTLKGTVTHGPVDLARGTVTLAAEQIATILPGLVVDGLVVVDVQHELTAAGGLRTTVWGSAAPGGTSRRLSAWKRLFEALDPDRKFGWITEFRVGAQEGERYDLQPVRVSTGMPELIRVKLRPGVAGCRATVKPGARVLVGFVERNPGMPYVTAFEDPEGDGFSPLELDLNAVAVNIGATGQTGVATQGSLASLFVAWLASATAFDLFATAMATALPDINNGLATPQPTSPPGTITLAKNAATAAASAGATLVADIPLPANFSASVKAAL